MFEPTVGWDSNGIEQRRRRDLASFALIFARKPSTLFARTNYHTLSVAQLRLTAAR